MLLDDVGDKLSRYRPGEDRRAAREAALALLDAGPAVVTGRAHPAGHFTASALVLSHELDHVLLVLHRKVLRWLQPGGHLEPTDATLAGAVRREVAEETGLGDIALDPVPIDLDRHLAPCGGRAWHHDLRFAARAAPGATPVVSEESLDVRWAPLGALPRPLGTATARLIPLALARLSG